MVRGTEHRSTVPFTGARSPRSPSHRLAGTRLTLAHGLMVVAGLVTFVLVASVLQKREATVEVLVATSDIAAGATVTEADFDVVDISAADPLLPVLLSQLPAGSVVTSALAAGEPLLRSDVVVAGGVASGRTFTLEVDRLVVDGLGLAIGDRVDVIGVDAGGRVGFVVVDVAVSRLPGDAQGSAFAAAASRSAWVTVTVDEAQALALSGARRLGAIELVRSTGAAPIDSAVTSTGMPGVAGAPIAEPGS